MKDYERFNWRRDKNWVALLAGVFSLLGYLLWLVL